MIDKPSGVEAIVLTHVGERTAPPTEEVLQLSRIGGDICLEIGHLDETHSNQWMDLRASVIVSASLLADTLRFLVEHND